MNRASSRRDDAAVRHYLDLTSEERAEQVSRVLGSLNGYEAALLREAIIAGFVQGHAAGRHGDFNATDDEKVAETINGALAASEFYLLIAAAEKAGRSPASDVGSTVFCDRCIDTPSTGQCCSSHEKELCHRCYRYTHFVEVCVASCAKCAAEGLTLYRSDWPAKPARRSDR